jgi:hypothetical protein
LDDILNNQRPSSNKFRLGYDHKETNKGLKFEIQKSDKNPKTYATALQSSFKREKNQIKTDSTQHRSALSPKRNEYIEEILLQEELLQKGINNSFLATIFLVIILGIKH